jgi:hypothetical protein
MLNNKKLLELSDIDYMVEMVSSTLYRTIERDPRLKQGDANPPQKLEEEILINAMMNRFHNESCYIVAEA